MKKATIGIPTGAEITLKVVEEKKDELKEMTEFFYRLVHAFCEEKAKKLGCYNIAFDEWEELMRRDGGRRLSGVKCGRSETVFTETGKAGSGVYPQDMDMLDLWAVLRRIDETGRAVTRLP